MVKSPKLPKLTKEEKKAWKELQDLSEADLLSMLGLAVIKEEILKLLETQSERQMGADVVETIIIRQMPDIHKGTVRRTIRLMVDESLLQLLPGNILKI